MVGLSISFEFVQPCAEASGRPIALVGDSLTAEVTFANVHHSTVLYVVWWLVHGLSGSLFTGSLGGLPPSLPLSPPVLHAASRPIHHLAAGSASCPPRGSFHRPTLRLRAASGTVRVAPLCAGGGGAGALLRLRPWLYF